MVLANLSVSVFSALRAENSHTKAKYRGSRARRGAAEGEKRQLHKFYSYYADGRRLAITDYLLPDMSGLYLFAAVKAASPTTYVVLTSADNSAALTQQVYT